jgi:hypothetical protein
MAKKKVTVEFTDAQYCALELQALESNQTVDELVQTYSSNYANGTINGMMNRLDENSVATMIKAELTARKKVIQDAEKEKEIKE